MQKYLLFWKGTVIMSVGISTSCFYPESTEDSLKRVIEAGAKVTEVFFNAPSELERPFLTRLSGLAEDNGVRITSIHPFTSFAEGYILFSKYRRRFEDYRDFYRKYYAAAAALGAKTVVLHGALQPRNIEIEEYAERLQLLMEDARECGVALAQENVVHHVGQTLQEMEELRRLVGDGFHMVLDIKQSYLAGVDPLEFFKGFAACICHLHLSDHDSEHKCLPPFDGNFDFAALFSLMRESGYSGDAVIELYRSGFEKSAQLTEAMERLQRLA